MQYISYGDATSIVLLIPFPFVLGDRLANFDIQVGFGRYKRTYRRCGPERITMKLGESSPFKCNATGDTVKIQIHGEGKYFTVCEVFVYGRGDTLFQFHTFMQICNIL